jgi:hypothetical protein
MIIYVRRRISFWQDKRDNGLPHRALYHCTLATLHCHFVPVNLCCPVYGFKDIYKFPLPEGPHYHG